MDCVAPRGTVADLTRDLRRELHRAHFEITVQSLVAVPFFKAYTHYPDEVIGCMVKFRCTKTCQDGCGPPFCAIWKRCQEKGIVVAGSIRILKTVKNWIF